MTPAHQGERAGVRLSLSCRREFSCQPREPIPYFELELFLPGYFHRIGETPGLGPTQEVVELLVPFEQAKSSVRHQ